MLRILTFLLLAATTAQAAAAEKIVLAGGCFWGVEAVFEHTKGVSAAVSGYAGDESGTADYETVSTGETGHAESVEVTYDPAVISLSELLDIYFTVAHDPTELNRQGPDTGTQYRSEIFYTSDAQKKTAAEKIAILNEKKIFPAPIVTKVEALKNFYPAEDYHQDYLVHHPDNPYIIANDLPKIAALKARYPALYKD